MFGVGVWFPELVIITRGIFSLGHHLRGSCVTWYVYFAPSTGICRPFTPSRCQDEKLIRQLISLSAGNALNTNCCVSIQKEDESCSTVLLVATRKHSDVMSNRINGKMFESANQIFEMMFCCTSHFALMQGVLFKAELGFHILTALRIM